jgi:hypothetical protein
MYRWTHYAPHHHQGVMQVFETSYSAAINWRGMLEMLSET